MVQGAARSDLGPAGGFGFTCPGDPNPETHTAHTAQRLSGH